MIGSEVSPTLPAAGIFAGEALLYALAALVTLLACEKRLPGLERLPRNRWIGLFFGWGALAVCVPHAEVVCPAFLLPLLWPLAVAVPVLGFFFVDYPAARALGGSFILMGYYLVHCTFDLRTPGFPVLAVAGWLVGIAGIWVSAKPCAMRDYLRLAAVSPLFRFSAALCWGGVMLFSLWALFMTPWGGR